MEGEEVEADPQRPTPKKSSSVIKQKENDELQLDREKQDRIESFKTLRSLVVLIDPVDFSEQPTKGFQQKDSNMSIESLMKNFGENPDAD